MAELQKRMDEKTPSMQTFGPFCERDYFDRDCDIFYDEFSRQRQYVEGELSKSIKSHNPQANVSAKNHMGKYQVCCVTAKTNCSLCGIRLDFSNTDAYMLRDNALTLLQKIIKMRQNETKMRQKSHCIHLIIKVWPGQPLIGSVHLVKVAFYSENSLYPRHIII